MTHKFYSDAEVEKFVKYEPNLYFNPANGEAVMFFPKPEIGEDATPAMQRMFRDRDVYIGLGVHFENVMQKLPTETSLDARVAKGGPTVPPWNFPTAETVGMLAEVITPCLKENGADFAGVALAKSNTQFPHVHTDGTTARARELMIVRSDGTTKRLAAGLMALQYGRSLALNIDGSVIGLNTFTLFAELKNILQDTHNSGDIDVDLAPDADQTAATQPKQEQAHQGE